MAQPSKRTQVQLDCLDDDTLTTVLTLLSPSSKLVAEAVCKRWQRLLRDSVFPVWTRLSLDTTPVQIDGFGSFCQWVSRRSGSFSKLVLEGHGLWNAGKDKFSPFSPHALAAALQREEHLPVLELRLQGGFRRADQLCFWGCLPPLSCTLTTLFLRDLTGCISADSIAVLSHLHQLRVLGVGMNRSHAEGEPRGFQGSLVALSRLTNLELLNIQDHPQLQDLPSNLGSLQTLVMYSCPGVAVPLAAAASLERLHLIRASLPDATLSQIRASPSVLQQCTAIELASISSANVFTAFAHLPELEELALCDINVGDMHADWPQNAPYQSLLDLKLEDCDLDGCVPHGIFTLTGLWSLTMQQCGLQHLPADITRLQGLSHLDLTNNAFITLPTILCSLRSLATITFRNQAPVLRVDHALDSLLTLPELSSIDIIHDEPFDHASLLQIIQTEVRLQEQSSTGVVELLWRQEHKEPDWHDPYEGFPEE